MKFGGTSVKDAKAMLNVVEIVKIELPRKPVIVVSALAGVTNLLVEALPSAASSSGRL